MQKSRMNRRWFLAILVTVAVIWFVARIVSSGVQERFYLLRVGMTSEEVKLIMGRPTVCMSATFSMLMEWEKDGHCVELCFMHMGTDQPRLLEGNLRHKSRIIAEVPKAGRVSLIRSWSK